MSKSVEYELLKKNRGVVEDAISTDLKWIAEELSSDELPVLTDAEFNDVTNPRSVSISIPYVAQLISSMRVMSIIISYLSSMHCAGSI